jgi:hypothetical protein
MKSMKKVMFYCAGLALILACGLPDLSAPSTVVPAVTNTAVPDAPANPNYQFENIAISIPDTVGNGISGTHTDEVELPFINPSNGPMPQHVVLTINGYPLARGGRVMIFDAAEYAGYADITQQAVATLQSLQYETGQPIPDELELGPLSSRGQALSLPDGHGLRYIAEIRVAAGPVTNQNGEVFYYFEGLSNDNQYYISAVFPIHVSFLAEDYNAPPPADGVPYPGDTASVDQYEAYYSQIAEKLNTAGPSAFLPSLDVLDGIIQSIKIY